MTAEINPCNTCTIRKSTVFSNLNKKELNFLGTIVQPVTLRKKDFVFLENEPITSFYLIKNGLIKIYKSQEDGRQQILRLSGLGDIIGLDAIFSHHYVSTAQVVTDSVLCRIPQKEFLAFISQTQKLALKLLQKTSEELAFSRNQIFNLGTRTAKERIADFLLYLHHSQCSCEVNPRKISFPMTRQEISELLGLKQETVIRTLSQLKSENVIQIKGRDITLLNLPKLSELSHSSPTQ